MEDKKEEKWEVKGGGGERGGEGDNGLNDSPLQVILLIDKWLLSVTSRHTHTHTQHHSYIINHTLVPLLHH